KSGADYDDARDYYRYRWMGGSLYRSELKSSGSSYSWSSETAVTFPVTWPGGTERDADAEKQNFANWYSYHRTRIKIAKAGASEAFGQIGAGVRVGYDSIWNRNSLAI